MSPTIRRIKQRHQCSASRRQGFTLIEIGVALAIFIIGALAIIRIFPPALGVIQNSGDRQVAIGMNRNTLADYESKPEQVPDAIYDARDSQALNPLLDATSPTPTPVPSRNYDAAVVGTRNNALPGTFGSLPDQPLTPGQRDTSATGHFRYIVGERHKVLVMTGSSDRFVLLSFPFAFEPPTNPTDPPQCSARVFREAEVEGVRVKDTGDLDFSDATLTSTGASFSDSTHPERPPLAYTKSCLYYVSYRWREDVSGGTKKRIQGIVDEPLAFPSAEADPAWTSTGTDRANRVFQGSRSTVANIVDGVVSIRFRQYLNNAPDTTLDDSRRGLVRFSTATTDPIAGEMVSVDYQVRDWSLLVDDSTITADGQPALVTLPIRNLFDEANDKLDDSQNTSEPKQVLLCSLLISPNTTTAADAGKFDLRSFQWITPAAGGRAQSDTDSGFYSYASDVDMKRGLLSFKIAPSSPQARTVYSTLDRWTHQVSVAARSYVPFYSTRNYTPREEWREYASNAGSALGDSSLYFPASEAGKTIMVSFEYQNGTNSVGDPVYQTVNGGIFTIEDKLRLRSSDVPALFNSGSNFVSRVALTDQLGNPIQAQYITAILSVQGIGVQARTAWLDGDRFTQAAVTSYRSADAPQ